MNEKEYETYKFIIDFIKEHNYSPSYREIAKGVGCALSTVMVRIDKLVKMGKIETKLNHSRSIKVVGYQYMKER